MTSIGARAADSTSLVGRAAELLTIDRVLAEARSGSARGVVVLGEPGIGKTRMLAELCSQAATAGFDVLMGRGSDLERDLPFGVFVDALDERFAALDDQDIASIGSDRVAELASVLPSLAGGGGQIVSRLEVERFEFHRAVRAALCRIAASRPLVLVLDDVHWADPASAELICHLLGRLVPGMVLALAYRPRQTSGLLLNATARAGRDGLLCEIELAPWTVAEAAKVLGEPPDSAIAKSLHSESGGNPFYLEQLARTVRVHERTPACLDPVCVEQESGIPTALRTMITNDLTGLALGTRAVLQSAAVAGDPFDVDLVTSIAEVGEDEVLNCLDRLVAVDLLRTTDTPGQFRFRHPIVRRVVYDEAELVWRFNAHKRAAEALAQRGGSVGARAHHIQHSARVGDDAAIALLTEAGLAAAPRAPAAAAGWFEAALGLLPETGGVERRLRLMVLRATSLAYCGRLLDCRAMLEQVLDLVPVELRGDRVQIITMAIRADHGLGRAEEAQQLIGAALDEAAAGSAEAIALQLVLAENCLMRTKWREAVDIATQADVAAERLGDPSLQLLTQSVLALLTAHHGDIARARNLADLVAARLEASEVAVASDLLEPLVNLVETELGLDRFRAASRHAERGLKISRATGHGHLVARFMVNAATAKLMLGQLNEARNSVESADEMARLLDNDQLRTFTEGIRCYTESLCGDVQAAVNAGHAAVQAAERAPWSRNAWLARACYGEALIDAGEFAHGRHELLSIGGPDMAAMPPSARPFWDQALVRAELAVGDFDAAEPIAQRMEEFTFGLKSREAHAHYARAQIHIARGEFLAAAATAKQAQECYDTVGMTVWAARARLVAGQALARSGNREAAVTELELAHGILRDAGAMRLADEAAHELRTFGKRVRRGGERDESADIATLTEREHEIADRVSQGYTNREIAAELFISPKTVEKYLARVFAKLGASSRAGVAAVMTRLRTDKK